MVIRKALIFVSALILCFDPVLSQKYTNYEIAFGINGGLNNYSSSFSQLPGIKNNYKNFTSASGLGIALNAGLQYGFGERLFGAKVKYSGSISYFSLSADYNENEFIGNYLTENGSSDINVNHLMACTVSMLGTEHYALVSPFEEMPLSFKFGILIAFPLTADVHQVEKITSPEGVNFRDTHQPTVNEFSGKIPDFASFYPALAIGARYDIYQTGNFVISPEISYIYGFINVNSTLDWTANQARFGVNISYKIEKPAPPRPPAPPMPSAPEPPAPPAVAVIAKLDAKFKLMRDNTIISNNDTLDVELPTQKSIYTGTYLPMIFFEENSTEVEEMGQGDQILKFTLSKLGDERDLSMKMILTTSDEDSATMKLRERVLRNYFVTHGVKESRLSTQLIYDEKPKNEKLDDESRNVRFEFSDGSKLIRITKEFEKVKDIGGLDITVLRDIYHDAPITAEEFTIHYNNIDNPENFRTFFLEKKDHSFNIPQNLLTANTKSYLCSKAFLYVSDTAKNVSGDTLTFFVKPRVNITNTLVNPEDSDSRQPQYEIFQLCYFSYDQSDIYAYDQNAVDYIKKKIQEGKRVEIIPSTDDLGTPDYNKRLSQKRADAAIKLLGVTADKVGVIISGDSFYPNEDPYKRNLNRGVFVKVYY